MRQMVQILWSSFKIALRELKMNPLRTFLSLFGITIGIFCIIGVLSAVNSLSRNIKKDLKSIGNNTLFISKWQWSGNNNDYPWWVYARRPNTSLNDLVLVKERSLKTQYACFATNENSQIEKGNQLLGPVVLYSITADFIHMQDLTVGAGRYISTTEFASGANVCLLGYENAVSLFGKDVNALGQTVRMKGQTLQVIGVFKRYGRNILQGWDYDHCAVMPHTFYQRFANMQRTNIFIMAKPYPGIELAEYMGDLKGAMRGIRKLPPGKEDNFSVNDMNVFTERINEVFVYIQLGGSVIALFSLIVGAFGVANIMFVTVKERTPVIGLKKAIGAKRSSILAEFLLESAFLCILGGLMGLALLWGATILFSRLFHFEIIISAGEVSLAILLCTIIGILSGYVPARQAANMDAVVAIRSK
jgi:putative ABC transport system permease protein